jgi:hypothetical protein
MNNTITIFDERKEEAEFYLSVLDEILSPTSTIITADNQRFGRILKSNFFLMLYNLIESTVRSGFEEIYYAVRDNGVSYQQVSDALKDIWSTCEILKANQRNAMPKTYAERVKSIIITVLDPSPLVITKDALDISGNLDARQIKKLMETHDITITETVPGEKYQILLVKNKRNALAHGEQSFDEAARDSSLDDLKAIRDEVFMFVGDVLKGMQSYYNSRKYIAS